MRRFDGRADRAGGQVRGKVAAFVVALVTVGMTALPVGAAPPTIARLPGMPGGVVELRFEGVPSPVMPQGVSQEFSVTAVNNHDTPYRLNESRITETHGDNPGGGFLPDGLGVGVEINRDGAWQTLEFRPGDTENPWASAALAGPVDLAPGESVTLAELRLTAGSVSDGYLRHGNLRLSVSSSDYEIGPDEDAARGGLGVRAYVDIDLVAAVYFDGFPENWVRGAPARELTVRVTENVPESAPFRWSFETPVQGPRRAALENEDCLVWLEAFDPSTSQWRRETAHEFPLGAYATGPLGDQALRLRLALSRHFPAGVALNYGISSRDDAPIYLSGPAPSPAGDSPGSPDCADPAGHLTASPPAAGPGTDANGPEAQAGSAGHSRRPLRYAAAGALILLLGAVAFAQRRKKQS
jgi:hypothetical protein